MIIKSMSRHEPSFTQLFEYMRNGANRDDDKYMVIHNCFSRKQEKILEEFNELSSSLSHRKNGVYLYHEVISIKRTNRIANKKQKQMLEEIAREYIKRRANENLVVGFMHDEKDNNLHYHLMISSNKVGQKKRFSLRKKEFDEIKHGLEEYVLTNYPELEQERLISRKREYWAQKKALTQKCQFVFSYSNSIKELNSLLKQHAIALEKGTISPTVIDLSNNKKHRISTLGLLPLYRDLMRRITPKKSDFGTTDEWIFGDFTEREARIEKQKRTAFFDRQRSKDEKHKESAFQTPREQRFGSSREWVAGDFSERDARVAKKSREEKLKRWQKKTLKDAEFEEEDDNQTLQQKISEATDELVFGDFSKRDARKVKTEAREKLRKMREYRKMKQTKGHSRKMP